MKNRLALYTFFLTFGFCLTANATTYYQTYGSSKTVSQSVVAGTHYFQVDGIAQYKYTEWYVNGVYKETDYSGFLAIDPEYSYTHQSGTVVIKGIVYNSNWTVKETHVWNVSVLAPDLIVTAVWTEPSSPTERQGYVVKATVKNQGTANAIPGDGFINVRFYIGNTDLGGETDWKGTITAGGSYTFTSYSKTAPAAGPYTVKAVADYNGDVAESNEGNNNGTSSITIQAPPKPDLVISSLTLSQSSGYPGQNVNVDSITRNSGTADTGWYTWCKVRYYLGRSSGELWREIDWGWTPNLQEINGISIGEEEGDSTTWTVASDLTPGQRYYITAVADADGEIGELDEANNKKSVAFDVTPPPKPDLYVRDIQLSVSSLYPGQSVNIDCWVNNQGNATANRGKVKYYLGKNSTDTTYKYIDYGYVPNVGNLGAGSEEGDSTSYTIPPDVTPGTYYIVVVADADNNEPNESKEENNVNSKLITIASTPKPDLIVTAVWTEPATPTNDSSYVIKATVNNQGTAPANPTGLDQYINCRFYIGTTDLGQERIMDLCTSIPVNGTFTFTSSSKTAPVAGPYTIKAVADSQGDVAESNENNNDKTASITVQDRPKDIAPGNGIWIYPDDIPSGSEASVVNQLQIRGIKHVFVFCGPQSMAQYNNYLSFIQQAHTRSMTVHSVCWRPDDKTPTSTNVVQSAINQVVAYNSAHPEAAFDGVQLDIENITGLHLLGILAALDVPPSIVFSAAVQEDMADSYDEMLNNTDLDVLIPMLYIMDSQAYVSGSPQFSINFVTISNRTKQILSQIASKGQLMVGLSSYDREFRLTKQYTGNIWGSGITSGTITNAGNSQAFDPGGIPALVSAGRTVEWVSNDNANGISVYRFSDDSNHYRDEVETTPICLRRSIATASQGAGGAHNYVGSCIWNQRGTFDQYSPRDEGLLVADDNAYPSPQVTLQLVSFASGVATIRITLTNANPSELVLGASAGAGVHLRLESATFQSASAGGFHAVEAFDQSGNLRSINGSQIVELRRSFFENTNSQTAMSGDILIAAPAGFTIRYRSWMMDKDSTCEHSGSLDPYIARFPDDIHYNDPSKFLTYNTYSRIISTPTDIMLSNSGVQENQPAGTTVGTFSTTDSGGGNFTYTLVTGLGSTDNGSFTISGSTLKTAALFNYEAKNSYSIRVRTTDQDSLWYEKVITVTVNNVNEAPADILLSNASVQENQPSGTTVGSLSTTDPDTGNTFTYSLVSGSGSSDNGSFTISGSTLKTAASFDYEAKNSYSIRVRTTDQDSLWYEKAITITVLDVPEPVLLISPNSLDFVFGVLQTGAGNMLMVPDRQSGLSLTKQSGQNVAYTATRDQVKERLRAERTAVLTEGRRLAAPPPQAVAAAGRPAQGMGLREMTDAEIDAFDGVEILRVTPKQTMGVDAGLPASVDHSQDRAFPEIRSQGGQNSCACFSTVYYYKTYQEAREHGWDEKNGNNEIKYSSAFIYNLINGGVDQGSHPAVAMQEICQKGVPTLASMPYTDQNYTSWGTAAAWKTALPFRAATSAFIDQHSEQGIELVKQHLANGDCAVVCSRVFDNWYSWWNTNPSNYNGRGNGGVDNFVLFENRGSFQGAHAMTLVGYDDDREYRDSNGTIRRGAFKVANSWGADWSDRGFFWMSYDFVKGTSQSQAGPWYIYIMTDRANYSPSAFAQVRLEHSVRSDVTMRIGTGIAQPTNWQVTVLSGHGGGYAMPAEGIWVDLSEGITSSNSVKCAVTVADSTDNPATGTLVAFITDAGSRQNVSRDPPIATRNGQTITASLTAGAGETSTRKITLSNIGTGTLQISGIAPRAGKAWLLVPVYAAFTLTPGQSKTVDVTVDWSQVAVPSDSDWLQIFNNTPDSPYSAGVSVQVVKDGIMVTANPRSQTNNVGESAPFTVSAISPLPVKYQWQKNGIDISGQNASEYMIRPITKNDEGRYRCVVSNETASVKSEEATLTVNLLPSQIIRLSGDLNFGSVQVGKSAQRTLTIHNDGTAALTVNGITYPPGFSGAWSGTISAGGSQNVQVTFAPSSAIPDSGNLTVSSDATSGNNTCSVSGTGVSELTRIIRLSGDLSFGSVQVGKSAQRTLTIHNDGTAALTVSGITYPAGFSGTWSGSVPAGGSQNVSVTYVPSSAIIYSGNLTVGSDATSGNNTCPVSGTGVLAAKSDFNGDGLSDLAVQNKTTGTWYIRIHQKGGERETYQAPFGGSGQIPMSGDYDGDRAADLVVYDEATGSWSVLLSGYGFERADFNFGGVDYQALAADFDGDGMDDPTVYNPKTGDWKILMSASGYACVSGMFGGSGYTAVSADYDGDGKDDPAVYEEAGGRWQVLLSGDQYSLMSFTFGEAGDVPVPGDYDGDGVADPAVYARGSGQLYIGSMARQELAAAWGTGKAGWIAVSGDYDGDGKDDIALYDQYTGIWNIYGADGHAILVNESFGGEGYLPVREIASEIKGGTRGLRISPRSAFDAVLKKLKLESITKLFKKKTDDSGWLSVFKSLNRVRPVDAQTSKMFNQQAKVITNQFALTGSWESAALGSSVMKLITQGCPPSPALAEKLKLQWEILARRSGESEFSVLRSGGELASEQDEYLITARPLTAGYLYLFQVDAQGQVDWLFPANKQCKLSAGANPVKANEVIQIPAEKPAFRLDDNVGVESVYAVFSATRWPELEQVLAGAKAGEVKAGQLTPVRKPGVLIRRGVDEKGVEAKGLRIQLKEQNKTRTLDIPSEATQSDGAFMIMERQFKHVGLY